MTLEQTAELLSDERDLLIGTSIHDDHDHDASGRKYEDFADTGDYDFNEYNKNLLSKLLSIVGLKTTAQTGPTSSGYAGANLNQADWLFQRSDQSKSFYSILNSSRVSHSRHQQLNESPKILRRRPTDPSRSSPIPTRRFGRRSILVIVLLVLVLATSMMFIAKLIDLIRKQKSRVTQNDILVNHDFVNMSNTRDSSRWIISSSKCHIPQLDEWHPSIKSYVKRKPPLNCTQVLNSNGIHETPLTYTRNNRLYFSQNAIKLNATTACCYREVTRSSENDDDLEYSERCHKIKTSSGLKMQFQLIRVECPQFNYTNVHSFMIHDLEEEAALRGIAKQRLNLGEHYNIVMVGVDTISRLNAYRQLNETLGVLRDSYETLEFYGYNKVGENTFPNLIPLLTGLRPEQLTKVMCWMATNYSQESERGDDYLDNCKYLWNYYQQVGYLTYFSEDWPKASTFNYLKPGFKNKPTSYYGRPFTIARDNLLYPPTSMGCTSCLLDRPIVQVDLENLKLFLQEYKNEPHFAFHWINCPQHDDLNGASQVDLLLRQFFEDIRDITHDNRTFVVFFSDHGYRWNDFVSTRIGHYESSLPLLTIAAPKSFKADHPERYANLKSHQSSLLTPFDMFKTMIDIRNMALKQSKETSDTIIKKLLKNRPTTRAPQVADKLVNQTQPPPTATTTVGLVKQLDGLTFRQDFETLSLLDSHNSTELDRSCIEAGIPDNYCVCNQFKDVPPTTIDVIGAAYYLVHIHMNSRILKHKDQCHPLDLHEVHKAEAFDFEEIKPKKKDEDSDREQESSDRSATTTPAPQFDKSVKYPEDESEATEHHDLPNREYNIIITTKPGKGLFQEVVRFYGRDMEACKRRIESVKAVIESETQTPETKHAAINFMNAECHFSVHSDSMSRLNLYKDQSKCVKSDIELKKICYCNDLLP